MMKITAIGLVSATCHECEELREDLIRVFGNEGIDIEFVDVSYDDDPIGSIESVAPFGLKSPPSFYIVDRVFTTH
jgi:hypothetical protein